jgi:hypothetical protein
MSDPIDSFPTAWTEAERSGDIDALDQLLAPGFYGVGPLGFILPKQAWLARHRSRDLLYSRFDVDEVQVTHHGPVAVVTARHITHGTYQGHPIPQAVRATHVVVDADPARQLAVIHMGFIAGTPGAPPIPGPGNGPQREGDVK